MNEIDQIVLHFQQYGNLDFAASQFQRLQQNQFTRLPAELQQHIYYQQSLSTDVYQPQEYQQLTSSALYSEHNLQSTLHNVENQLLNSQPVVCQTQFDSNYYQTVNSQESQSLSNASPNLTGDNLNNQETSLVPSSQNDSSVSNAESKSGQILPVDKVFLGYLSTPTTSDGQEIDFSQDQLTAVDLQQSSFHPVSLQSPEPVQPYNQLNLYN